MHSLQTVPKGSRGAVYHSDPQGGSTGGGRGKARSGGEPSKLYIDSTTCVKCALQIEDRRLLRDLGPHELEPIRRDGGRST
eukprot:5992710-Prymnesium_polylepis.1